MINPHPPLTGAPPTLLAISTIAEVLSHVLPDNKAEHCRRVSTYLSILAAVISPITYYTGYWGAEYANQSFKVSEDLVANHQAWAKLLLLTLPAMLLFLYLSRSQQKLAFRLLYLGSLTLATSLVLYTSLLGGQLVFSHGAGVNAPALTAH